MRYLNNELYCKDIKTTIKYIIGFKDFYKKSVLVLGASGLIGSFIVDCFIYANKIYDAEITIYAVSRNKKQLQERFGSDYDKYLNIIETDVTTMNFEIPVNYIIHAASYGHPKAFTRTPVEVLLSNVVGTQKVLEIAKKNLGCRVLYISSGEVQEQIDHLSTRACYPIGKMAAETLCISFCKEYGIDVRIARPCHIFGANVTENDNKATTQFLMSAAQGVTIKMYSEGKQRRSFSYIADCVSGLLTALIKGEAGFVYGISSNESCTVKEFAYKCANIGNCEVEIHMPTSEERAESSPIKNQIIDNNDLMGLAWQPVFSIDEGIARTIEIIRKTSGG